MSNRAALEVDWAAIRAEWEAGSSDETLAPRWGFKSPNSITRRRKREGWTRDQARVDQVPLAVVEAEGPSAGGGEDRGADAGGNVCGPTPQPHTTPHHPDVGSEEENEEFQWSGRPPVGSKRSNRSSDVWGDEPPARGAEDVGGGEGGLDPLQQERLRVQRRQLRQGRRAEETAMAWLELLYTIATGDSSTEDGEAELVFARERLLAINREKDTTANYTKAMGTLLETGFKLQRQALGMDTKGADLPGTPPAPGAEAGRSDLQSIFRQMSPEMRAELRGIATRRAQGLVLEGKAEPAAQERR